MLDFVDQETRRIDSRFLEPACGNGNFLYEVLKRKLNLVKERYGSISYDFEKNAIHALTSIYGVDLLEDNVIECRERLYILFSSYYSKICKTDTELDCLDAAKYILERNILCGDALTLKTSSSAPIIFSEWSFVSDSLVKRRDYRLDEMLDGHEEQMSIFMSDWSYDNEVKAFIPNPIREYPVIDYRKVHIND